MSGAEQTPQPPDAPEIPRRIQLHRLQLIAIPLVAVIPLLALLGLFSPSMRETSGTTEGLELVVRYPARAHYRMSTSLVSEVRNTGSQPIQEVAVVFEEAYITAFEAAFTPEVEAIRDGGFVVRLRDLEPGETRAVSVSLEPEGYWLRRGSVRAVTDRGMAVRVGFRTFTIP